MALTYSWFYANTGILVDADVAINANHAWNAYSGPTKWTQGGEPIYDLHRVLVHEFGHVLGLTHPDQAGQTVTAIMNSAFSDVDRLQADDIAGATAIYSSAPTDDHGDTTGTATVIAAGSTTSGFLETAGDSDVFQVTLSQAGILTASTSGTTDTFGTLLNGSHGTLATNDDGGLDFNFSIAASLNAGTYFIVVTGYGSSTGSYTLTVAFAPAGCGDGTINTGEQCDGTALGGATCESLDFDGGTLSCSACAYDTTACTTAVCGDGTINTGEQCDGTALGGATCESLDFDGGTLSCSTCAYDTTACTTDELPTGNLENPGADSYKSGIGIISGWVCSAGSVLVTVDGTAIQTAYGTERTDTESVCGDSDNGFGALWNWNRLGDGIHTAVAYADGVEFDRAASSNPLSWHWVFRVPSGLGVMGVSLSDL